MFLTQHGLEICLASESLAVRRFIGDFATGKPIVHMKVVQPHTALSVGNYTIQPTPYGTTENGSIVLLLSSLQIYHWSPNQHGCKGEIFLRNRKEKKMPHIISGRDIIFL